MHLELAREHRLRETDALRRRAGMRRRRLRRGVYLLPSMFTLANMFCGYACVVFAMQGKYETAAPFVAFAVVLDMLDGRIARMTGTTSAFGLEFDSLADVISFGIAPAILIFAWGLEPLGRLGWAAGFIFVTAGAIRLARFNIQTSTDKRYFVGMPIPAAAAVPAATVFVFPDGAAPTTDGAACAGAGARPGVPDGQHHPVPQLQDDRPAGAAVLQDPARCSRSSSSPSSRTPAGRCSAIAYRYLVSAFVEMGIARYRRRGTVAATTAAAQPAEDLPPEPPGTRMKNGELRTENEKVSRCHAATTSCVTALFFRSQLSVLSSPLSVGNAIVTRVPCPVSLVTAIVPPFNSMLRRAIARPRPVPTALVEK